MREKLAVTTLVIMLALFALIFRIWYIQDHFGEEYNQRVLAQQQYDSRIIPYRRGDIVDRNGTFLATTNKVYTLILDPYIINQDQDKYLEPTVTLLSEVFGYSQDDLRKIIADRSDSRYVRYAKNLTYDQKTQFESRMKEMNDGFRKEAVQQRVNGAWFEDAYIRSYPQGALGCNVIGFSQSEGAEGSGGIEQYYNSQLVGTAGREYGYLNDEANLERVIKPAADGNTVVSTIDVRVQSIIERHIAAFEAEMGGNNTCVIVMNPKNGEILGMATNHRFDLNDPRNLDAYFTPEQQAAMTDEQRFEAWNLLWRNFCVSDTYEPGSTSKIFTVAAGLENGTINGTEVYNCGGSLEVGGWPIHCAKRIGHGPLDITESIMQSCNVVMMRIVQNLGKEKFAQMQRLFGFGSYTGIDLPAEADTSNLIYSVDKMGSADLATNSFGQNYNCTMIQMAAAFCSAINGGNYYQPHVVKQILNAQGSVLRDIQPELVRETCSAETSAFLRNALHRTVSEGTGKAAGVEGYDIGGKTGTAEKYPRSEHNYLVSFCGFAPTDDPQVLCYVIVDTPHTADQPHSTFASGIFHNIMEELLPYLNVFPNTPVEAPGVNEAGAPLSEGINDNSNIPVPAETRPAVIFDDEESVDPAVEGEEALPGTPAGQEAAPQEPPPEPSGEEAAADAGSAE